MKYIIALTILLFPVNAFAASPTPAPSPRTMAGRLIWAAEGCNEMPSGMIVCFALLAILIVLTILKARRDIKIEQ